MGTDIPAYGMSSYTLLAMLPAPHHRALVRQYLPLDAPMPRERPSGPTNLWVGRVHPVVGTSQAVVFTTGCSYSVSSHRVLLMAT